MIKRILALVIIILIFSCQKKKENLSLVDKVIDFQVSECQNKCGLDSVGVRENKLVNKDLSIRLGYIVNCSWNSAFVKNIHEQQDTLIIKFDRYNVNGDYPTTSCNCFYFFSFKITDYTKKPKVIRVEELFEEGKYWDERTSNRDRVIEEETLMDFK